LNTNVAIAEVNIHLRARTQDTSIIDEPAERVGTKFAA
jgi:hypothetical protein